MLNDWDQYPRIEIRNEKLYIYCTKDTDLILQRKDIVYPTLESFVENLMKSLNDIHDVYDYSLGIKYLKVFCKNKPCGFYVWYDYSVENEKVFDIKFRRITLGYHRMPIH
jgi:hypothetical protein